MSKKADYGDFTEYEVRCLVADYCRDIATGMTGWGVPFTAWVEIRGIAKHDKLFRLIRMENAKGDSQSPDQ